MSASLLVDLGSTTQMAISLPSPAVAADGGLAITSGGCISSLSGVLIGDVIDLLNADTYCNVFVAGKGFGSGPLLVGVQTADATTSGSFTDPTSGLGQLPTAFASGGWLVIGSGPATDAFLGIFGSGVSGQIIQSGFVAGAGFNRPHRYARLLVGSGFYDGTLMAGFITNKKITGSGGGFTFSPGSGVVSV